MLFVSNRTFTLRSTSGHAIAFEKGVPESVPRELQREVVEKGCVPCDKDGKILTDLDAHPKEEVSNARRAPDDDQDRNDLIAAAIGVIYKRNKPAEFAGGSPSPEALTAELGWRVDKKEARKVWESIRADLVGK